MRRILVIFFTVAIPFCFYVCNDSDSVRIPIIELPEIKNEQFGQQWLVVNSPILRMRQQPAVSARLVTTLVRGSILEVKRRSIAKTSVENQEDYWYQVAFDNFEGWIFGAYVEIFPNYQMAESASVQLSQ